MKDTPFVSEHYPTLTHMIEITHSDYHRLCCLMIERGEYDKFRNWLSGKFIRITSQGGLLTPDNVQDVNTFTKFNRRKF